MDLKDVILSTLEELEDNQDEAPSLSKAENPEPPVQPIRPNPYEKEQLTEEPPKTPPVFSSPEPEAKAPTSHEAPEEPQMASQVTSPEKKEEPQPLPDNTPEPNLDGGKKIRDEEELRFLTSLRERVLVLFEGIQSPNNKNIEAKADLMLNFFEYQLAIIDERIDQLSSR